MIQNSEYLIHELKLLYFREICKVRALRAGQLKVESCLSMPIHVVVIYAFFAGCIEGSMPSSEIPAALSICLRIPGRFLLCRGWEFDGRGWDFRIEISSADGFSWAGSEWRSDAGYFQASECSVGHSTRATRTTHISDDLEYVGRLASNFDPYFELLG